MENISYEKLVEIVTAEVMKVLDKNNSSIKVERGLDLQLKALVIGTMDKLPGFAVETCRLFDMDSYDGDISGFDRIFITKLSYTQLADIALGRNDGRVQCAVINALLSGKKIYLLESALEHRKYKKTASKVFYKMLEGYVHNLESFGVQLVYEQKFGKNLDRCEIVDKSADKVITENAAKSLIKESGNVVKLRSGTIITPSAKDVFLHSDKTIEFVD